MLKKFSGREFGRNEVYLIQIKFNILNPLRSVSLSPLVSNVKKTPPQEIWFLTREFIGICNSNAFYHFKSSGNMSTNDELIFCMLFDEIRKDSDRGVQPTYLRVTLNRGSISSM